MSADPDLLPSSVAAFTEALHGGRGSLDAWLEVNDEREVRAHVEAYARANVAHATAAKDAEVEALRAKVEDGRRRHAATERDACQLASRLNASEKRAETILAEAFEWRDKFSAEKARAERLAEALRPLVMAVEALKFDIFRLATPELQEVFDGRNVVSVVQQSTTQPLRNALLAARAALDQENDDA